MPLLTIKIAPIGNIDRRNAVDEGDMKDCLIRENFEVIGIGNARMVKKLPGTDRYTATGLSSGIFTWAYRYYSANRAKSFAFSNGVLYHAAPNGTLASRVSVLSPTAYPSAEIMKVSGNDVMYFVDGVNGMWSHDGNSGHNFTKENSVTLNFIQILSHLDRMWGFEEDSDTLRFSVNLNPVNYTDSADAGSISIGAKRGAKIQYIALLYETLFIFKEDSIWVLEGRTPSEFQVRQVHPFLGVAARNSVQSVETAVVFLGSDFEFHEFGGSFDNTKILTYNLALSGDLTKDLIPLINRDRMTQVVSTYHNYRYRCSFVENGESSNNLEFIFNTMNRTYTISRGFNITCYSKWGKAPPDKNELIVGIGTRLHYMYRGLNIDNDASGASMPVRLQTKFVKPKAEGAVNFRFPRAWLNLAQVLGAEDLNVRVFVDGRNRQSDASQNRFEIQGETVSPFAGIRVSSQDTVTTRQVLGRDRAKGQSISFDINAVRSDLDLAISSFEAEVIQKERKRRKAVGV